MSEVISEVVNICIRWLHVIAGIAWIGSSFYFIHLDLSLKSRPDLPPGTKGEAWQVHGGGFYNMVKFVVAPPRMPDELTWFKWEAYTTWVSGIALMIVTYYLQADLLLIDRSVLDLTPVQAVAISFGTIVVAWLAYEALCRSPLGRNENLLALVGFVFLVALCYGFSRIFSGRGTFLQMGALIGTIMAANVFAIIIPGQKKTVAALIAGQAPDPRYGEQGKQRSVHNNYLTLAVVFVMISNHYPLMYATEYNWVIFAVVLVIGAIIRHFYNRRHAGLANPWWTWAVAAAGVVVIAYLAWAGTRTVAADAQAAPSSAEVVEIVTTRCAMCHAAQPVWEGFQHAPRDVRLDTPEEIARHAKLINTYAVLTRAMPPDNVSMITDEERDRLAAGLSQFRAAK
jgi:uncharacterized membrane protein